MRVSNASDSRCIFMMYDYAIDLINTDERFDLFRARLLASSMTKVNIALYYILILTHDEG